MTRNPLVRELRTYRRNVALEPDWYELLTVLKDILDNERSPGAPHLRLGAAVHMAVAEALEARGYCVNPDKENSSDNE